jgi:hypothetical protein
MAASIGLLLLRHRIVQKGGAGPHLGNAVADADHAQGQARIHVAVEMHHADGAAIPCARALLVLLDEAHGPELRGAGDRHRPGMRQETVEGVHVLAQTSLDMVDRVDQLRVHLDLPPADDAHRTRLADPALVVAVDIRAHGQLGFVLLGIEQLEDLLRIGNRVLAAADGPGNRAGLDAAAADAHEHFRRGADQELALAEMDEEGIGRGIDRFQLARNLGRRGPAALEEHLAGHDLEQVAAQEALLRLAHQLRIFAGPMVAARRIDLRRPERLLPALARQPARRPAVAGKLVAVDPGPGRMMVDHENLVRQEQDQVALARRTLDPELYRLELEGEVVAKGAIEAETGVLRRAEQPDNGAQHAEDRGHARALLLGERPARLADPDLERFRAGRRHLRLGKAGKHGGDRREHGAAAPVQRLDPHVAALCRNHQRRIDNGRVPARIAAGIFVIGGEYRPQPPIQPVEIALDGVGIGRFMPMPVDPDPALRHETRIRVGHSCCAHFRPSAFLPGADPPRTKNGRPENPLRPS